MGIVYVVEHIHVGGRWALKIMHPELVRDPDLRSRFAQEARTPARIRSDHIVKVTAAGVTDEHDQPYYIMELLEGLTLAEWIERHGPLSRVDAIQFFKQLFHAISIAHSEKIVHRDLKPANIFMADAQSANVSFNVKVLDFGIAKVIAEAKTARTQVLGSAAWMAPEQTRSNSAIGPQADVWALGLIAFYVLTGRSYWLSVTRQQPYEAILRELLLDQLQWASGRAMEYGCAHLLPDGFDAWFKRCVCRDPAGRFADAGEAWTALSSVFSISLHSTRTLPLSRSAESRPPVASSSQVQPGASSSPPPEPTRLSVMALPSSSLRPHWHSPSLGTGLIFLGVLSGVSMMAVGVLSDQAQPDPWRSPPLQPTQSQPASQVAPAPAAPASRVRELRVGFLHLGPLSGSRWSQAHEQGRMAADKELNQDPQLRVITHSTIANTEQEAARKIGAMIDEQHDDVVVATSVEFERVVVRAARNNPSVQFLVGGSTVTASNIFSYHGRLYQAKYLAGMLAANQSKSGVLGYVGARPIPEIFNNINAFTLGARQKRPNAQVHVRWVGSWSEPLLEQQLTRELISQGAVDVITMDTDSMQVLQTVESLSQPAVPNGRRILSIGANSQYACREAAPKTCLSSVYWNWGPLYSRLLAAIADEKFAQTFGKRSPLRVALDPDPSRSAFNIDLESCNRQLTSEVFIATLNQTREAIANDSVLGPYQPFVGPLRQVGSPQLVLMTGQHLNDEELQSMCWYVEGVVPDKLSRDVEQCQKFARSKPLQEP